MSLIARWGGIKISSNFLAFVIEPNTVDSYGFIVCGKNTGAVTVLLSDQNLNTYHLKILQSSGSNMINTGKT
jgi:hypothetical protein